MRVRTREAIVALALATLLGLGGCAEGTGPDQTVAVSETETQTQVESQDEAQPQTEGQSPDEGQAQGQDEAPLSEAAERQSMGLEGVGNARQLVGYVGEGGRKVKDAVLLRTAALGGATEDDIRRLAEDYHLGEIVDLRMTREIEKSPELVMDGVKNVNLLIIDEEALARESQKLSPEDQELLKDSDIGGKLMIYMKLGVVGDQMYVNFLSHDAGKKGYAQMFDDLLALPEGKSLLFHCTQGKDRTGCAAMLILSALGVDEETIMADYLLTNEFNAKLIEEQRQQLKDAGVAEEDLDGVMIIKDQVFPQTMTNALDWMKENYGSVRGYITQELDVTDEEIAQLQDKFLE